mgnify:CR=1 FL=1
MGRRIKGKLLNLSVMGLLLLLIAVVAALK